MIKSNAFRQVTKALSARIDVLQVRVLHASNEKEELRALQDNLRAQGSQLMRAFDSDDEITPQSATIRDLRLKKVAHVHRELLPTLAKSAASLEDAKAALRKALGTKMALKEIERKQTSRPASGNSVVPDEALMFELSKKH